MSSLAMTLPTVSIGVAHVATTASVAATPTLFQQKPQAMVLRRGEAVLNPGYMARLLQTTRRDMEASKRMKTQERSPAAIRAEEMTNRVVASPGGVIVGGPDPDLIRVESLQTGHCSLCPRGWLA